MERVKRAVPPSFKKKEADSMKTKSSDIIRQNKDIASVFVVTAAILMVPLVAMRFSDEWDWGPFDFAIIGTLLAGTGLLVVLALRKIKNINYRVAAIAALLAALLLTWIHLAVGIVDTAPFAGS